MKEKTQRQEVQEEHTENIKHPEWAQMLLLLIKNQLQRSEAE